MVAPNSRQAALILLLVLAIAVTATIATAFAASVAAASAHPSANTSANSSATAGGHCHLDCDKGESDVKLRCMLLLPSFKLLCLLL